MILWEKGSRGDIKGGGEELPETPIEKGPHTRVSKASLARSRGAPTLRPPVGFLKDEELGRYGGCLFMRLQARRVKETLFIWPPFSQYNKRLLRQKTGGACLYMPQDGHYS